MLKMLQKLGVDVIAMREKHIPGRFLRFQFNSKRKRMTTVIKNCGETENGHDRRSHMKGAAEKVLESCTSFLNENGQKVPINDGNRNSFLDTINNYASQSLRTISFAYKDLKANEGGPEHDNIQEGDCLYDIEKTGYTLIAIIGIRDVIREEVPEAVMTCQRAGINVRMVTGDNKITAQAIAKECNILNDENSKHSYSVMEGKDFHDLVGGLVWKKCGSKTAECQCQDEESKKACQEIVNDKKIFKAIAKELRVLARSRPEDKYLLVTGLKELGEVVAVTGDGTNDAPALKKADVGFAMGITGTEIAKHAAAIIIMDDNFASIVKACMWGRNIYDNIRRFLMF